MNPKLIQALLKILRESPAFMEKLASKSAVRRVFPQSGPASIKVPTSRMINVQRAKSGFPPGETATTPGAWPYEMHMERPHPSMQSGVSPETEEMLPELIRKIYEGSSQWR